MKTNQTFVLMLACINLLQAVVTVYLLLFVFVQFTFSKSSERNQHPTVSYVVNICCFQLCSYVTIPCSVIVVSCDCCTLQPCDRSVQSTYDKSDSLQSNCGPDLDKRKRMDGWMGGN